MASRFLQYAAVGAVATAAHYAILVGLVEAGLLAPQRAAAVGAWVGAQVAFAGNAAFTFRGRGASFVAWLRFQVTAVIGAVLSFALVAAGTRLGVHYLLAQVAATLVTLLAPSRSIGAGASPRASRPGFTRARDSATRRADREARLAEVGGEVVAAEVGGFAAARGGDRVVGPSPPEDRHGWQNSRLPGAGASASHARISRR